MVKTKQKQKKTRGVALDFFLQEKYETRIGFGLHKPHVSDDSFYPF